MSQKIKDDKNRWRSKSVGFRVSPEEWDVVNDKVRLCGYQKKQDYIMECITNHKITAKGNPLMLTQFRADLKKMLAELERIHNKEELDEAIESELFASIKTMLQILEAFKENSK
ncbi:MAG: plasmid mobilization protein [Dysgonomonas sp.]